MSEDYLGAPYIRVMAGLGKQRVRIDWYGRVIRAYRSGVIAPLVSISCSVENDVDQASPVTTRKRLTVDLPIQLLPLVRLGDIWADGRVVGSESLSRHRFANLRVDEATQTLARSGNAVVGSDFITRHDIPFHAFNRHKGNTLSRLVKIQAEAGILIMVPSLELVRFYFGGSGALLAQIFSGAHASEGLYKSRFKNPNTGWAKIELAQGVPPGAAAIVARIAFDSAAQKQLRNIVNSGVSAAASGDDWHPAMQFPFSGLSDLVAEGHWIESSVEKAFLATRLVSCSHPFPFSKLQYTVDRSTNTPGGGITGRKSESGVAAHALNVLSGVQNQNLTARRVLTAAYFGARLRAFPDLERKSVRRIDLPDRPIPHLRPIGSADRIDEVVVGGTARRGQRGLEVTNLEFLADGHSGVPVIFLLIQDILGQGTGPEALISALERPVQPEKVRIRLPSGLIRYLWTFRIRLLWTGGDEEEILLAAQDESEEMTGPAIVANLKEGMTTERLELTLLRYWTIEWNARGFEDDLAISYEEVYEAGQELLTMLTRRLQEHLPRKAEATGPQGTTPP